MFSSSLSWLGCCPPSPSRPALRVASVPTEGSPRAEPGAQRGTALASSVSLGELKDLKPLPVRKIIIISYGENKKVKQEITFMKMQSLLDLVFKKAVFSPWG